MLGLAPASAPVSVDPNLIEILVSPGLRIAAFVWGALWGSFSNVVIHRLPRGESVVKPRSRCPGCETPIAWYDNIPILSYLLLRGRCRKCEEPFALRYLLVELLGGLLSFATYMLYVVVPMLDGRLKLVSPEGEETYAELKAGQSYFRAAGVHHNVINANDYDFAFVEIEFK